MRGLARLLRSAGAVLGHHQPCSSSHLQTAAASCISPVAHQQQYQQIAAYHSSHLAFSQQPQQQKLPCQQHLWQLQQQRRCFSSWHGVDGLHRHSTTILCVRRGSEVVIIGDGQATQNDFIVKSNVRKVRRIGAAAVGGFAGVAVDGLALLERLENKLEEHPGQLQRAAVELAKMWRQDKLLRELDASLIVADAQTTLWLMGNGDVLEAGADGVIGIGSGADFAESAARALMHLHREKYGDTLQSIPEASESQGPAAAAEAADQNADSNPANSAVVYGPDMSLLDVAQAAMKIAADCCVYTNSNFSWYHVKPDGDIVAGGAAAAAAAAGGGGTAAAKTA